MSQSASKTSYKQMIAQPLAELERLFPTQGGLVEQNTKWRSFSFEQVNGYTLNYPYLIEDFFSGQDVKVSSKPWGDPAKLGKRSLNLRHYTQRLRPMTSALKAIQKPLLPAYN